MIRTGGRRSLVGDLLAVLLAAGAVAPAKARQVLFVFNGGDNTVREYNPVSGSSPNSPFISPGGAVSLAADGNNGLYLGAFGGVEKADATTGAPLAWTPPGQVVPPVISMATDRRNNLFVAEVGNTAGPGAIYGILERFDATNLTSEGQVVKGPLGRPFNGVVADANNHVFLSTNTSVGRYDANAFTTSLNSFIGGLNLPEGLAIDTLNHLFIAENGRNAVSEYDAATGAVINANFITGIAFPELLALDTSNRLFVLSGAGTVGEFDATSGVPVNPNLINGLAGPFGLAFSAQVPEPSSLLLIAVAGVGLSRLRRRKPRSGTP